MEVPIQSWGPSPPVVIHDLTGALMPRHHVALSALVPTPWFSVTDIKKTSKNSENHGKSWKILPKYLEKSYLSIRK